MPIYLHENIQPEGEIGLWDITETETFFKEELILTDEESEMIGDVVEKRRKEWMAGRLLLHKMTGRGERAITEKDEHGKPHLLCSPYDISLSHSGRFAAVIAAPKLVGIDVQHLVPKLKRIERKFMTEEDLNLLSEEYYLEHLHVYWGAKEALYKAYGKKKLEFREHILLEPFNYNVSFGECRGYVKKDEVQMTFEIHYRLIENYMLVYAVQIEE